MADFPPGFDEKMEALCRAYAAGLPAKRDAMRAAAGPLAGDSPEDGAVRAAVSALRTLAHKLAGSAPTFGFSAVGEVASEIETLCDGIIDSGGPPTAEERARLVDLVHAFGKACDAAIK